jgi:hypothetical protein
MLRFILEKLKLQISKKKRKANRKKGKSDLPSHSHQAGQLAQPSKQIWLGTVSIWPVEVIVFLCSEEAPRCRPPIDRGRQDPCHRFPVAYKRASLPRIRPKPSVSSPLTRSCSFSKHPPPKLSPVIVRSSSIGATPGYMEWYGRSAGSVGSSRWSQSSRGSSGSS